MKISDFKKYFDLFSKNNIDINNRILLSFDLNPYNDNEKITWDIFNKFKKIIVDREENLHENSSFLIKVKKILII